MFVSDSLIFDEYIVGPTSASPAYTGPQYNSMLARMDQMAIFTVCDSVSAASDAINVAIEHSSDGRLWLLKNPSGIEIGAANNAIGSAGPTAAWGYDRGIQPSLAQARLKIYFGVGTTKAHVRVYVTSRDPRRS